MDPFFRDTVQDVFERLVLPEMAHAEKKHGQLTTDLCRVMAILTEELGEAAAEALGATREKNSEVERRMARTRYVDELTQVAATAIRAIAVEMAK